MPYLKRKRSEPWLPRNTSMSSMSSGIISAGDLNYSIHQRIAEYIKANGGISYQTMNDVFGVLECVKMELYRRIMVPYEDTKMRENGDVEPYISHRLGV